MNLSVENVYYSRSKPFYTVISKQENNFFFGLFLKKKTKKNF